MSENAALLTEIRVEDLMFRIRAVVREELERGWGKLEDSKPTKKTGHQRFKTPEAEAEWLGGFSMLRRNRVQAASSEALKLLIQDGANRKINTRSKTAGRLGVIAAELYRRENGNGTGH